jgi:hypothetical protein
VFTPDVIPTPLLESTATSGVQFEDTLSIV